MPKLQRHPVAESVEVRRFPNGEIRIVTLGDFTIGEFLLQPGWRWSRDIQPIVGTPEDAFRCFMGTGIETLAVENCFLRKEEQDPSLKLNYETAFSPD